MDITARTRLFGLLGDPVDHSLSPVIWNAAFAATRMNAVYLAFRVPPPELEIALRGLKAAGVSGLNVTRPHKEEAFRLCTSLRGAAAEIGAVNTIWFPNTEEIAGANTDADAFYDLLQTLPEAERVLLLGAGGAARAVLWALCQRETPVVYWTNRTGNRLKTPFPTGHTQVISTPWEDRALSDAVHRADIIVNATSLGWHDNDRLDVLNEIDGAGTLYIDMNYGTPSRLLRSAREAGARIIDGSELLIRQGAAAFSLVTGQKAPEGAMRSAMTNLIRG
ncbi:MAG TPA: shikimate dehydrogenase [Candidatus Ozemobacteraceae bacterium]|nr:shikimate dehydrogenase [Candidatus Ozemobacteraceae bacterium]